MSRYLFATSVVLLFGTACGTEPPAPGTLTLVVNDVPEVTVATRVNIQGKVTREPEVPDLPLVVSITTPIETQVDTAAANGTFLGSAPLTPDASTIITVTASDGTGSSSVPLTLSVVQDGTPPTVAQWSPANEADLVASDTVRVRFDEPIRPLSFQLSLQQNSQAVSGRTSLSADSLTLTFAPIAPLALNAIYHVSVSGATDVVGNRAALLSACFITGGALATVLDPENDYFVTTMPPAPATVPTDLVELRFWWYVPIMMDTTTLRFLIRYTLPRSLDPTDSANTFVALDFDLDLDSTTGVPPIKDLALGNLLPSSGIGADYGILIAQTGVSVIWTGPLEGRVISTFVPDVCGRNIGFSVPRSAIGVPVGPMRLVVYTETSDPDTLGFADAGPDSAYYIVPLPSYGAPAVAATGVRVPPSHPLDQRMRVRLRQLIHQERRRAFSVSGR